MATLLEPDKYQVSAVASLQEPAPGRLYLRLGRVPPDPAAALHPLAGLNLLVDGEKVLDLQPLELG